MIQVKELTKIYKSRKGGTCVALDHISFTLPEKGFIFVIGKSGSGKTTLLSLLGGLDTITSGEIIENGRKFSDFSLKDQIYYRNSTIGFIFQDFHLLDHLTIFENVMLALQLQGTEDEERVLAAIRETGLEEYKDRYPKELSGGQKQRVAIARALVKQPSILLADEPTGNLDTKTTVQILDLLKELSKDKLVVIVSHNLADARNYADEILELSDGKIVGRQKRNEKFDPEIRVEDDTLVIPYGAEFTDEDLRKTEQTLKERHIYRLRQDRNRFEEYRGEPCDKESAEAPVLQKKHLKFRHTAKLAVKFARRGWPRMVAYAVILAALMVILGLSQLIMNFNGGEIIASEMGKRNLHCNSFVKDTNANYASTDATRLVDIEEGDIQKFYDGGYTGEIYPLVNYALFIVKSDVSVRQKRLTPHVNPYNVPETVGVLITEESFLEKQFGSLEYLARSEDPKNYGVYVTDFFVDALMLNHPAQVTSYQSVLGKASKCTKHCYGYINGVIKTGYKERHKDLLDKLTDPLLSEKERIELAESEACIAFYDEIYQYLDVAYSFDKNFVENSVKTGIRQLCSTGISVFKDEEGNEHEWKASYFSNAKLSNSKALGDNEIVMNYAIYNELFKTAYTPQNLKDFEPQEVDFSYYSMCDETKSQKKYEAKLTIVGLNNNEVTKCNVADNILRDLQRIETFTFGLYFENEEQAELLFNLADGNSFLPNSSIAGSITTMTKAVNVFSEFFNLIFIVLCVALLLLMIQFEVKNIKDKMQDIGIMKALGSRDIDLILIFGFQVAAAGLLMALLFIAGSFVFIGVANDILVLSLSKIATNTMIMNLSFLTVKWKYLLYDCLLAFIIILFSFIVPMLRLRRIKPTNVIKSKE